jgi:hypothetical protein
MPNILKILIILAILVQTVSANNILELAYKTEYEKALSEIQNLPKDDSSACVLKGIVLYSRFDDLGDTLDFHSALSVLENCKTNDFWEPYRLYNIGLIKEAIFIARRAALMFEKRDDIDSKAFYAIYSYYAPFVKFKQDDLKTGFENSKTFSPILANSLIWIFYDKKKYAEALSIADTILKRYPEHPIFLQTRADMLGKKLRAEKGSGPAPVLAYLPNQDEEASYCADKIEAAFKKGAAWSDWAILYRTNAQSMGFETLFLRRGIPYRVVGSLKFYEREEIKDALALLSFLVNPRDEVAFRRVVNKPARGVGPVTVDKIVENSFKYNGNLIEAGRNISNELAQKARKGIEEFIKVIEAGQALLGSREKKAESKKQRKEKREDLVSGVGLSVCVTQLVKDSGIAELHQAEDEITGNNRISNLQELVNAASEYPQSLEGLLEFLEHIELDRSMADEKNSSHQENAVTLITFHNTKGLEFKRVIMTGLEHGVFPREDKKDEELEEERRLFYVGATRAMDELYLTTCAERRMYGRTMPTQPSLFVREIDRSCLEIDDRTVNRPMAGRSFNPYNTFVSAKGAVGGKSGSSEAEERSGWKRGQRVLHDDHGYGAVVEVKESEDGTVVRVRFDSGKETRFLSEYQSRAYEKIYED